MARYTTEDQEFFFEMANKILDRFGLLEDVKDEYLVDVIEFYSDLLCNAIDVFISWKEACRKRHLEPTTEALSQEC